MKLTLQQGKYLVKLARSSIAFHFENKQPKPEGKLKEKLGVFVTLKTTEDELRGCIGFITPNFPLEQAILKAAASAAFNDPRFSPLKKEELDEIKIEISILTKPELIKVNSPEDYPNKIKIGEDGLIIDAEGFSGLLLPQVAVEHKLSAKQFLDNLCLKAGLLIDTWKLGDCKIYKFQAQIFSEGSPNGAISEIKQKSL